MMNPEISSEEKLFRNVITHPDFWKKAEGKPSSAVFKDSNGVSVDRDGGRDREAIVSSFQEKFGNENIKAIVLVKADFCIEEVNTHLLYSPVEDNPYHAEIYGSPQLNPLTKGQARKLANNCTIVHLN